jgi:hypothetical protein
LNWNIQISIQCCSLKDFDFVFLLRLKGEKLQALLICSPAPLHSMVFSETKKKEKKEAALNSMGVGSAKWV